MPLPILYGTNWVRCLKSIGQAVTFRKTLCRLTSVVTAFVFLCVAPLVLYKESNGALLVADDERTATVNAGIAVFPICLCRHADCFI